MKALIITLVFFSSLFAKFRMSDEAIMTNKDASALHFIGSAYLSSNLEHAGLRWWQADAAALLAGVSWEIKDGLLPYEKYGYFGGDGFSRNDIICDLAGIAANRILKESVKILKSKLLGKKKRFKNSSTKSIDR